MISEYHSLIDKVEKQLRYMYEQITTYAAGVKTDEEKRKLAGRKMGIDIVASGWNAAEVHIQLQDQRIRELEKENARLRKLNAEHLDPQQQYELKLRLLIKQYTRSAEDIYQGHQVDIFHHPSHADEKEARRLQTLKSAKQHYPDLY